MSVTDSITEYQRFEQHQQSVETQQLRQLTNKGQKGQLPRTQRGKNTQQENQTAPLSVSLLPSSIIDINAQFQRNIDLDLSKFPFDRFKNLIFSRGNLEKLIQSPHFDKCVVGLYGRVLTQSDPVREYGIVEVLRVFNDLPQEKPYPFANQQCTKILRAEFSDKTTKQYKLSEFSGTIPAMDEIRKWARDRLNSGNDLPTLQYMEKKEKDIGFLKQTLDDIIRKRDQKKQNPQIRSEKQLALQILQLKDQIDAAVDDRDNIRAVEFNKQLTKLEMQKTQLSKISQDKNKDLQLMKKANDALTHKSINKEEEEDHEREQQQRKYIQTLQMKNKGEIMNI